MTTARAAKSITIKPIPMTLKELFERFEENYEISISLKSRHRTLPTLSITREDYGNDTPEFVPIFKWDGQHNSQVCEEVIDTQVQLMADAKIIGSELR